MVEKESFKNWLNHFGLDLHGIQEDHPPSQNGSLEVIPQHLCRSGL